MDFEGRFDRVRHAGINPRPEREIPIWIGGMGGAVLDRTGRLADGWLVRRSHYAAMAREPREEDFAYRLERVREAPRAAGRDPGAMQVVHAVDAPLSVAAQVEAARRWGEVGATHVTLNTRDAGFGSLGEHVAALRAFRDAYDG